MRWNNVGVIHGGLSAEREVSLATGRAVGAALEQAGYRVTLVDAGRQLDRQLREAGIDAAFVALHGRLGEDGTVQGLLEVIGVPYTGSSVLASALAMDKVLTREILAARGLPVAPGICLEPGDPARLPGGWSTPVVVKPADEGSSVGVSIVRAPADLPAAVDRALQTSSRALVEQFVTGVEVNVAVLDGDPLGAVEIEAHREFYDYSAKYDEGGSTHHIPPRIPEDQLATALDLGRSAYAALGCSGAARVDLIVPENGDAVILEVNTIPGMTETSLLPEIAAAAGIPFPELAARIVEGARLHASPAPQAS